MSSLTDFSGLLGGGMSTGLLGGSGGRRRSLRGQASPFKLTMLMVIDEHCKNLFSAKWAYEDEAECELLVLLLHLVQGPDLSLSRLLPQLSATMRPEIFNNLLIEMQGLSARGLEGLLDLVQMVQDRLFMISKVDEGRALMTRTSVLGMFVRWLCVAFDKLEFRCVSTLFHQWSADLHLALSDLNLSLSEDGGGPVGGPGGLGNHDNASLDDVSLLCGRLQDHTQPVNKIKQNQDTETDIGRYTHRQAEFFIAQQGLLIGHNEGAALTPRALQLKVNDLFNSNPDLAEANFLSYINQLRVREYCGAIDALFHYFDRSQLVAPPVPSPTPQQGAGGANKPPAAPKMADDESELRGYRFAALNLAALQYRYGHRREAIAALRESIRMAQQASDSVCLQHALGWLQRLGVHSAVGEVGYMLDRLISATADLNLHYLTSLGVQALVKHSALTAAQPSTVLELLVRSDVDNSQHCLSDLTAGSLALEADLWALYGRNDLCSLHAQMLLHLGSEEAWGGGGDGRGVRGGRLNMGVCRSAESECLALCHMARLHADQGLYRAAGEVLASARARFPAPSPSAHLWLLTQHQTSFIAAWCQGQHSAAERAVCALASINGLEALYCRCLLLIGRGEASRAIDLSDHLLTLCQRLKSVQQPLTHLITRALLVKGEALCAAGCALTASAPMLDALTLARQAHLSHMATLATVRLAFVQYGLGEPRKALALLAPLLAPLTAHAPLLERARAHHLAARCHVTLSRSLDTLQRHRVLLRQAAVIEQVVAWFHTLKASLREKHALHFLALLYNEAGQCDQRNRCAQLFRQLNTGHPSSVEAAACAF